MQLELAEVRNRTRLALSSARDRHHLEKTLARELGPNFGEIETVYLGDGTRFVTLVLNPDIGPILVEAVGWPDKRS